jgi:hypothetical protein
MMTERLDLFLEIEAIGEALTVLEEQYGHHPDLAEARDRQQQVRIAVLAQLRSLLPLRLGSATVVH